MATPQGVGASNSYSHSSSSLNADDNEDTYVDEYQDAASSLYYHSSCSMNPYDVRFVHDPLLQFDTESCDLKRAADFSKIQTYYLHDICLNIKRKGNGDEETFYNFINENFSEFIDLENWSISFNNSTVKALQDQAGFLGTNSIKPYFVIESKKPPNHPLLFLEIVSTNHLVTVYKSASNLIDQLRWLRSYDDNIDYVFGYVIPNSKKPGVVTKVKIEWKDLAFCASYQHFSIIDFLEDFEEVLQRQCCDFAHLSNENKSSYFIKLSNNDLQLLGKAVQSDHIEQKPSKFSILFCDAQYYYKIIPEIMQRLTLTNIETKNYFSKESYPHVVFPEFPSIKFRRIDIFRFPLQPYKPLTSIEAKKCLGELARKVVEALDELHTFGYAHCDVRLLNICFTREGDVRLIDLDRAVYFNDRLKKKDFTRLGIILFSIKYGIPSNQLIKDENFSFLNRAVYDPFIVNLIRQSTFDRALFAEFMLSHPEKILQQLNAP